jgi:hypothetical protein
MTSNVAECSQLVQSRTDFSAMWQIFSVGSHMPEFHSYLDICLTHWFFGTELAYT